jgi:MFS family permease
MAETTVDRIETPALSAHERERVYRWNFVLFLADFVLLSIAFNLIGSTTVIPDYVRKLTDSEVLIGLSSSMFEIGWLLPQLLVAQQLVRVERKKWWFVGPNIPVRTLMFTYGILIAFLGPDNPGLLLGLFIVFYSLTALGDGLVGVPWLDLAGSSLDSKWRARMFGLGNASVGVLVLGLAPLIRWVLGDDGPDFPNNYALLFVCAGVMFFITVPFMIFIRELPGGKARETSPSLREYLPELVTVLREDAPFRAMITARVLAALFMLAGPFYIGFATEQLDLSSKTAVGDLLPMQTIGNVGGALLFSWLGDRRSLQFIRLALLVGMLQPILALLAGVVGPIPLYLAFLAGGFMGGTLGFSFMNWVVGYATPDQRPTYSGLFNSVSAIGLLTAPLMGGLIVQYLGYEAAFVAALAIMSAALYVSLHYISPPSEQQILPVPGGES